MYLFYVVDGLDIKKIEKNEYFCTKRFFPDYYRFFPYYYDFIRFFPRVDIILITISATLIQIPFLLHMQQPNPTFLLLVAPQYALSNFFKVSIMTIICPPSQLGRYPSFFYLGSLLT